MGKECECDLRVSGIAIQRAFRQSFPSGLRQIGQEGINLYYHFKERRQPEDAPFSPIPLDWRVNSNSGKRKLFWRGYSHSIERSHWRAAALARLRGQPEEEVEALRAQARMWRGIEDKTQSLGPDQAINYLVPKGINPSQGVSFAQIVNINGQLHQQFQLLPFKNEEEIKRFEEVIVKTRETIEIKNEKKNHLPPLLTWVVRGKPVDFESELPRFIEKAKQPLAEQPLEEQKEVKHLVQPQLLPPYELFYILPQRQNSVLMFRNNETKIPVPNGLIFEAGEKKQEVQQKPPTQEVPIGAKFSQLEPLSMFQIIGKNSSQTVVQEAPVVLLKKQVPQELFHYEPTVKVETQEEPVVGEMKIRTARELVVTKEKQEVAEEAITIPLIEIPMGTSMIYSRREKRAERVYIIEAELEPIGKEQTNMMETREESQEEPEKIAEQASQEMENEEVREETEPTEQKEPKIFAVEEFKVKPLSYINISIHENNRQEPEIEELEIKKLVWVVNPTGDQAQPAILELEFSKDPDPNKATLRFLHFLRKVARKVVAQKFGNDILRTRKIKMIRADEPVEVIRKIEYYLEVLKGTYAQVFAFVS